MKTTKEHIIREQLSPPPLLRGIGMLLVLVGFVLLFEVWQVGTLLILLSVPCFIPKRMRELDFEEKRYRSGISVGQHQFGAWKPFPLTINYISVIRLKQKFTIHTVIRASALSSTNTYIEYQVNLIYDKRKRFKIGVGENLEQAIVIADKCSEYLQKDIFVLQPGKKYWRQYQTEQ